jgi:hypothetical protein
MEQKRFTTVLIPLEKYYNLTPMQPGAKFEDEKGIQFDKRNMRLKINKAR